MFKSGNTSVRYVPAGSGWQKPAFAVAPLGTTHTVWEACNVNGNLVMPIGSVGAEEQIGVGCKRSGCWALVSCTSNNGGLDALEVFWKNTVVGPYAAP
jgi:hypothetical protein